jgi:uncharacterized protein YfaS (alpha-2-macroglobulin family)
MKTWFLCAFAALSMLALFSCGETQKDATHWTPNLGQHIVQYTAGVISAEENITVQFSGDIGLNMVPGTPAATPLFDIDPAVKGQVVWTAENALAFIPDERLASGKEYKVRFALGELVDVPKDLRTFTFNFTTIEQRFELDGYALKGHSDRDLRWNRLEGTVLSNDLSSIDEVAKRVTFTGVAPERVQWSSPGDRHIWTFSVDSIERTAQRSALSLALDGVSFSELAVPPLNDFSLLSAQVGQLPNQKITLTFSSPILKSQRLLGLFQLDNEDMTDVRIDGSRVECYPNETMTGTTTLRVSEGLKNVLGEPLMASIVKSFTFTVNKPAIEFLGEGNVVPTSGSAQVPFRAKGLTAVDVRVFQVFERNTHQFFQDNALSGDSRLRRVARPVAERRIELGSAATHRWENYAIDLEELVARAPGAIYRLEIGFRPAYSSYPCEGEMPDEYRAWAYDADVFSGYQSSRYPNGYRYQERDNPCHISYYGSRRSIEKNVLVSDVGLIVKGGKTGWRAYTTHISEGDVLPGATVELMNYQGQVVAEGTTDGNGSLSLTAQGGTPFLAVATWNGQKAYIKLENAASLSLSSFDVQGVDVAEGIQCMLYAERGVWRPGDTLFLDAILDDRYNPLPPSHPMVFTVQDAKGREVVRRILERGVKTIHPLQFKTDADAPTGMWMAKLEIGSASFVKSLPIETIQPNRLDISVEPKQDIIDGSQSKLDLKVSGEWLTGASAAGLKYELKGTLRKDTKSLKEQHPDFHFFDVTKSVGSLAQRSVGGTLGEKGAADVVWQAGSLANNPGPLELVTRARIYEPGGRFSVTAQRFPLAPFSAYVGFKMPETNPYGYWETQEDQQVEVIRIGQDGTFKPGKVKVEVFRLDWTWWWRQGANRVSRLNSATKEKITVKQLNLKDGRGSFSLNLKDEEWGRIYIRVSDESGRHVSSRVVNFDWSYGRRAGRGSGAAESSEVVEVVLDKAEYKVGDVAVVEVPSSPGGKLILSAENGSVQLQDWVVETTERATRLEIELTSEMAPHCYLHAMVIQPHGNSGNDRPIRMYGIVPVEVVDPEMRLEPELILPDEVEPNSTLEVTVSEANGQNMEYTLAVVDEGLLSLTRFVTPDPWSHFTRRSALGVRTWDMFSWVLEAFAGKIAKVLSVGGDGTAASDTAEDADRFRPVVRHIGPFKLKPGSTAKHNVDIKNYLGEVRVMVVSAARSGATGHAEGRVKVKQDLMVQLTLPRLAAPGERIDVPVTVFALEEGMDNVKLTIADSEGFEWKKESQRVSFSSAGQQTVFFPGTIQEGAERVRIKVVATARDRRAEDELAIAVRNPMPRVRRTQSKVVQDTLSMAVIPFGIPESRTCKVSLSKLPDIQLNDRLGTLLSYPHGCSEQVTSKGFAQLNIGNWVKLSAEEKVQTRANILQAIQTLSKRQQASGGFVYWPGNTRVNSWVTTYVGHFLIQAKEAGHALPQGMLERYIQYERKQARNWSYDENARWKMFGQGYRLYVLAMSGQQEVGAMTRLRNLSVLSGQSAMLLAAAYAELGESQLANQMLDSTMPKFENNYGWWSFSSRFRNRAMWVETLHKVGRDQAASAQAMQLAEGMGKGWKSTQDIAYGLSVLTEVFGPTDSGPLVAQVNMGKAETAVATSDRIFNVDAGPLEQAEILRMEHDMEGPVYVSVTQTAIEKFGEESAQSDGLAVSVRYMDSQGDPVEIADVPAGAVMYVEVTADRVDDFSTRERMALTYFIPAGWELSNARLLGGETTNKVSYQDIRDDRVSSYFKLGPKESMTLNFEVVATYPGRYYAPPVYAEAMYNGAIQASTKGQWVTVRMP